MSKDEKQPKALRLTATEVKQETDLPLPSLLRTTTRGGVGEIDPLLAGITVEKIYTLGTTARGVAAGTPRTISAAEAELLAIETEDGSTLFIRSDALAEAIERVRPEAVIDGEVDFTQFRDPNAAARGMGDVLWKVASVLKLPSDGLLEEAKELALEWAKEKLGEQVEEKAYELGSFLGAKALMWKIESRLAGRPGLYHWKDKMLAPDDRCLPGDPRLQAAARGQPMLVMIHGTGSYTLGSYADLREDDATWRALEQRFPGGIFGYEHRTFSQSPIENALELIETLPQNAKVSLLTHSRGGLVGDLLCVGQVDDKVIASYQIDTRDSDDVAGLEREASEERERLRAIRSKLQDKGITVARYVRVACPARGTRLLSENLDAALSDFLNLLQIGGGALVGAVASALGGPVAGKTFGKGASSALGVVKRLALEIAGRRIDPRMVPGIAAMCVESPLAAFLSHPETRRRDGIAMAVVAGDTEFDGFGFSNLGRRIANLFCDWRLFDQQDNDLVVDTDSMYAGLGFRAGASYLYDQDASVTHFRYFRNPPSRDALRGWLVDEDVKRLTQFQPLTSAAKIPWRDRDARWAQRGAAAAGPRPVAILIPGIMGSHIEINRRKADKAGSGDRIWFDVLSLGVGKLDRIADPASKKIFAEDIFEMFYGDLADHLAETHTVIRSPYDWRRPLAECAGELLGKIEQAAKDHPGQPIRLLAHSMGGLVVRTLMKLHPDAWQKVVDSGGRLVMLGTPNNGSHLLVHTLLGKTDAMRMLAKVDVTHDLQDILDVVRGFPGALSLLPRPGFPDAGGGSGIGTGEYYAPALWEELKQKNTDRWYGDGICGVPDQHALNDAAAFWQATLPGNSILNPERVSYVFGQSDKTPCGVARSGDRRLKLLFTPDGDGSVTWASGRLDNLPDDERCWYMPVEHADLTGEEAYFPAIVELMEKGATGLLNRLPRRRGEAAPTFTLEAAPPVVPNEEELARALMGSGPRRRKPSRPKQTLRVAVHAGDLRFVDQPVLCGHYIGDAISGAEAVLDEMLEGRLSERDCLGLYASGIGTSVVALRPPTEEERARGSAPGAVIVGLGNYNGLLGASQITETVRAAVLHYLLQVCDDPRVKPDTPVQLYSLLLGWNSTAHISIAESVAAVTRGVLEANHGFADALSQSRVRGARVSKLCFVELFIDAAITAAKAVHALPNLLDEELKRLNARIDPERALIMGEGMRERLSVDSDLGHWSRLIVTDADAADAVCPPECYELRYQSPIPPELLRRLTAKDRPSAKQGAGSARGEAADRAQPDDASAARPSDASAAEARYYPERLKYLSLSARARAETVVQQHQSGLIEAIIRDQRQNAAYDAKLGRMLFQLMVPLDYKAAAREQSRLLLVLDGYTANLPWELLQADGEPLVLRIPMVRQLASMRYRSTVRTANTNSACIIVAPDTRGFDQRFGGTRHRLDDLPGAVREGDAIRASLRDAGWNDNDIVFNPVGRNALDTFAALYARPYRVLTISGHGVFEARAVDGRSYSGVVLSSGLLITAVEIGLMEVVPELVFLNCCHLGSVSNPYSEPNRLAYSLARELIEMGVRCVVAAGWAVNDDAACTFASTFFEQLVKGESFGDVVFSARRAAFQLHPGSNTWGAYQAYGDPGYRLVTDRDSYAGRKQAADVAVEELLARLRSRRVDSKRPRTGSKKPGFTEQGHWVQQQLSKCPPEWSERPDVLQAIGALYSEYGEEGFEPARDAYERALQREDKTGRVSVQSIEQLANMEARQGGRLADKGQTKEGLKLIERAIERLGSLSAATADQEPAEKNAERAALLGSAHKRKAGVLAAGGQPWKEVAEILAQAAEAYRLGVRDDPASSPYNTLNALPLAWLSEALEEADAAGLALRCGEQARKQFASSKDFWDAVMCGDAVMTAWLLGEKLDMAEKQPDKPATPADALRKVYDQAVEKLPQSARQWDSVVTQWRLLARFLRLRKARGDIARAEVLEQLAEGYVPQPAPQVPSPSGAALKKKSAPSRPASKKKTAGSKLAGKRSVRVRRKPSRKG